MDCPYIIFDENLREVPLDQKQLKRFIKYLKDQVELTDSSFKKFRMLAELGVYQRIAGQLEEAEKNILRSIQIIKENDFGIAFLTQNRLRLGHVYQWQLKFDKSNALFDELIEICENVDDCYFYDHFAYQHAGKNYFDQQQYDKAMSLFRKALEIRTRIDAPLEQIESVCSAIECTEKRILQKFRS